MIRTNPKLTTNIKIVADSKNKIFLESIDSSSYLTRSIYKGYEVSPNGSYSYDLARFYSRSGGSLPESITYAVFEEDDSTVIKNRYKNQYDFTYGFGTLPKNSKLYTEEFSMFAPLWVERDNIPDYFVIFKMEGPVTINSKEYRESSSGSINLDTDVLLNSLTEDPEYFFENIVKKARVIKTFDLTDKSSLGKYIRKHVNDSNFPDSPYYLSLESNENSYWSGISYREGGFTKKGGDIYSEYALSDKTIIESEDFITDGFKRNSIVCANILNLEFLFDDKEQEKYKFSRYFGLFVNAVELGRFSLSDKRLFDDKDNETSQIPRPTSNKVGNPLLSEDIIQSNVNGIKIYPEVGPSGPYSGRLLTFEELQNSRFGYVKDLKDNFYSIDNTNNWSTLVPTEYINPGGLPEITYINDTNFLRIKNQNVNWKNFTGLESPFAYIPVETSSYQGRPAIAFKVVSRPNIGDEIRVQFTNPSNPEEAPYINTHTIDAFNTLSPGSNNGLTFSNQGTLRQISLAIVNAINQIEIYAGDLQPFKAILVEDEILVFSKIDSENWNKLKMSFFTTDFTFPFLISNEYIDPVDVNDYIPSPIGISLPAVGRLLEVNFSGGSDNSKSRAIVERKYVQEFRDPIDEIYIKTKKGHQTTGDYSLYLDEPIKSDNGEIIGFSNYNKYYVINLKDNKDDIEFGSSKKLGLQKKSKNSNGYFSILPIKDFDFDFYNQDYTKQADSDREKLLLWYQSGTGGTGLVPTFDWTIIGPTGSTSQNEIIDILGPTSSFVVNGGFQSLIGYQDDLTDTNESVFNEYDRLKENYLSELALSSRVVPFINKWVYDDASKDVRENDYRLNTDQAFGYSNFSPDFDQVEKTPKFFTHEWYYLQKYPPYMNFQDKLNSFSYFDEDLNFTDLPIVGSPGSTSVYSELIGSTGASANLLSIEEDYFLSYFTRETVDGLPIPRDFKYSLFSGGTNSKASETLFRGVKVEVIDRSEFNPINFNKGTLRFLYNEKYNGYRFSCLLTYGNAGSQIFCIKNDKWKSITLVITADLDDVTTKYVDNSTSEEYNFIDRIHLYTLKNKLSIRNAGSMLKEFYYEDKPLSGMISDWTDDTNYFTVRLTTDLNGNAPILNSELTINELGGYNDISVTDGVNTYRFGGVTNVEGSTFRCARIYGLPLFPSPLYPNNGTNNLNGVPGIIDAWGSNSSIYDNPFYTNPIYIEGGFDGYSSILDSISFSSIQTSINVGSSEIRYISVDSNGKVEENTFVINLVEPEYPVKSSYLERKILDKSPDEIQIPVSVLGYELTASNRLTLNQIARYKGNYSPRLKDIIQFVDTEDIKLEGLDYNNIQILDNLSYLKDDNLGKIKNYFYNKVNVENPRGVLYKFNRFYDDAYEGFLRIYPLLGEVAIDKDDFYIFKSNWDSSYYHKHLFAGIKQTIIGTREPKEEKSFFGSKVISIPNEVRIETFPLGVSTITDFRNAGSIDYVPGSIITEEKVFATKKEINVNIYTTKSLVEWLIQDGFSSEFIKYVDPEYSFGNPGIDDDARLYIKENIFDRYSIKEVLMWEKIWLPEKGVAFPNQIVTNLTDAEKSLQGYTLSKNFNFVQDVAGGLDFKVIYTIPKDKRTSICFTVVLEKK